MALVTDLPGAGWYPDPDDPRSWRYWDGAAWTEHRSPGGQAPSPPPRAPTGDQRPAWRWLAVVVVAFAVVGGLAWWATADDGPPPPVTQGDDGRGNDDLGGDDAVRAGTEAIAEACEDFAGTYGYGPSVDDVWEGGAVAQFLDEWPANAYTGEPMGQSTEPGDFTFSTAVQMGEEEYLGYVTGNLQDGESYPVEFEY